MKNTQTLGIICTFVFLLAVPSVFGRITDAEIRKEDRLLVPLDEPFGFGANGNINISLSGFVLRPLYDPQRKTVSKPNLSKMGILITTPYGGLLLEDQITNQGACALDSDEQITLITFDQIDLTSGVLEKDFALSRLIESYAGGEFLLYFANCEAVTAVDFDITLSLYNQKGAKFDFLPVGDDILPLLYFLAFVVFTALGASWAFVILRAKQNSHTIHYLMALLVALKSLTVLSQAGMYHMIAVYGHPEGWNIAFVSLRCLLRSLCLNLYFCAFREVHVGMIYK